MNREELIECIKIIAWRHNVSLATVARFYSDELEHLKHEYEGHDDTINIDALVRYVDESIEDEIEGEWV